MPRRYRTNEDPAERIERLQKEMLASSNPMTRGMALTYPYALEAVEHEFSSIMGLREPSRTRKPGSETSPGYRTEPI